MNLTKKVAAIAAVAILGIGFVLGVYSVGSKNLGATSYDASNLVGNVYQGMTHVLVMSNGVIVGPITTPSTNAVTLAGTNTLTGSVTISGDTNCTSTTWNPGAVSSTAVATTSLTLAGATLGDKALVALTTSTQELVINGRVSNTNTVGVTLFSTTLGSTDIATTTLKACIIH